MGEMDTKSALRLYEDGREDERLLEAVEAHCFDLPTLYAALPWEHGFEMPPEGAWIMVKRDAPTVIPPPPYCSIWRARTIYATMTLIPRGRGSRGMPRKWPLTRARIATPAGDLTLLPDEFVPVRQMEAWTGDIGSGVTLHLLGGNPSIDGDLVERVFQLQSRGLPRWQALSMVLPELDDPGFAWLSIDGVSDVDAYAAALAAHAGASA